MKRIYYFGTLALASVLLCTSCENEPKEKDLTPGKLLSVGFYEEDNDKLLAKDYVTPVTEESTIIIRLPEEARKSNTLVARFETEEGNIVRYNEEEAVEGKLTVNPAHPIDIVVTNTDSNISTAYEIKVGKFLGVYLKKLTTYSEPGMSMDADIYMKINPSDNKPYISYSRKETVEGSTTYSQASVIKWNGTSFEFVGKTGFTGEPTDKKAYLPTIHFDKNGTPFVIYVDNKSGAAITVMKFNGNAWDIVGNAGFGEKSNTGISLFPYPMLVFNGAAGTPVAVTYSNLKGDNQYRMMVSELSGNTWEMSQKSDTPTLGKDFFYGRSNSVRIGNKYYVLAAFNKGGYYLYEYENGQWQTAVSAFAGENSHLGSVPVDVDKDGNIYALLADIPESDYVISLYKADLENKTFVQVANQISTVGASENLFQDLAINPVDGRIVALYSNKGETTAAWQPYFGYIDSDTGLWSEFVVCDTAIPSVKKTFAYIEYAADGTGYAALSSSDGIEFYQIATEDDILPE